jgi:hypothetical protein
MKKVLTLLVVFCCINSLLAQNDTVIFAPLGQYNYPTNYSAYKTQFDQLGRPYLYAASKENGIRIFDISNPNSITLSATIFPFSLGGLKPTYLLQDSNYLYVGLGDFQGVGQRAGMAIIDVTTPTAPVILDRWDSAAYDQGVSSLAFEGNYVYLAAMEEGIIVLDISTPSNIQFVSRMIPDTSFPGVGYPPNARAMYVKNDTMLLAFDAGGLRTINCANKQNLLEIGMYVNTNLLAVAGAAYNDVALIGNYAYVPVDYCGLEVIDISNPALMTNVAWNNPWNCNNSNWIGREGHANQIIYRSAEQIVFVSAGDSEILAFDASDPSQPQIIGAWGMPHDTAGAWGLDVNATMIAVARVANPIQIPFIADTGGVKLLAWNYMMTQNEIDVSPEISVYPNPATDIVTIALPVAPGQSYTIDVIDITGRIVKTQTADTKVNGTNAEVNMSGLAAGVYTVRVSGKNGVQSARVVKT